MSYMLNCCVFLCIFLMKSVVNQLFLCSFPKEVESGLLEVISPSQHYYPDFTDLRETFGDSKDRVKYAYHICY